MDLSSPSAPPGWYPDPGGEGERWWDGSRWGSLRPSAPHPPPRRRAAGKLAPTPVSPAQPGIPASALWWAVVGFFVAEVLGSIGAEIGLAATQSRTSALTTLLGEIGLWLGLLGTCVLVTRRYGTASLDRDLGLSVRWRDVLWGLGAAGVGFALASGVEGAFAHTRYHGTNTQLLTSQRGSTLGLTVVSVAVALGAPLFEELFFRGFVRLALQAKLGRHGAVWVQAALFGCAHLQAGGGWGNVSVALAIGTLGVVLGYTAMLSGRLAGGMMAHSLFNLAAVAAVV